MNENTAATKRQEEKRGTAYGVPLLATALWLVALGVLWYLKETVWFWSVVALAVALVVVGCFLRPMRSGLHGWNYLVPFWGLVAWHDRVQTCRKLVKAEILDANEGLIPATTYTENGDTVVELHGKGVRGLTQSRIEQKLNENVSVWDCQSYQVSHDQKHPTWFKLVLSVEETVSSPLDDVVEVADDWARW